jgi:predicted nucleic acid-binding protein
MIFLFGTNAVSELMRKQAKGAALLTSLPPNDRVILCPIVRGEIRYNTLSTIPVARDSALRQILGSSVGDWTA